MAKKQPATLEDFADTYGEDTIERIFMEHILIMREQARRFREIESVLFDENATIDDIRAIFED